MIHSRSSSLKNSGSIISIAVLSITDIIEHFLIIQSKTKFYGRKKLLKILIYFQFNYINKSKNLYIYAWLLVLL